MGNCCSCQVVKGCFSRAKTKTLDLAILRHPAMEYTRFLDFILVIDHNVLVIRDNEPVCIILITALVYQEAFCTVQFTVDPTTDASNSNTNM